MKRPGIRLSHPAWRTFVIRRRIRRTEDAIASCRSSYRGVAPTGAETTGELWLVQIDHPDQLCGVVANVGDLERKVIREGTLYTQRPGSDVGRAQIAVYAQN